MPRARNSFRYLGIDILVQGSAARPVAKQRVASFLQRCSLVSHLPAAQRPFCTADAVASLWLSAGSLYTLDELEKMVSASASAFRPRYQRDSRVMLRSRLVEHLCGSLFHRTHPIAAAVYDVSLQIRRLFRFGLLSRSSWHQIWQARSRCRASPLLTLERCSKRLDIAWGSLTTLVSHDDQYSFTESLGVVHLEDYSKHLLREVLRTSAWSFEARRRPKDFIGTARGVDMDSARALYRVPYGPALLTAGSWTAARLYIAGLVDSPLCVRCGSCWDTKEHRLWWCDDNAAALRHLLDSHPTLVPSELPPCLRRCGYASCF